MPPSLKNRAAKTGMRLAAGTALFANPAQAQSPDEKPPEYGAAEAGGISSYENRVTTDSIQGTATKVSIHLPPSAEWTPADSLRFQQLVRLRAKDKAGDEEQREFAQLQIRRRHAIHAPTTSEILAECRRRRMANEILSVLNRHVRFFNPEDQKRIRSISKAHGK